MTYRYRYLLFGLFEYLVSVVFRMLLSRSSSRGRPTQLLSQLTSAPGCTVLLTGDYHFGDIKILKSGTETSYYQWYSSKDNASPILQASQSRSALVFFFLPGFPPVLVEATDSLADGQAVSRAGFPVQGKREMAPPGDGMDESGCRTRGDMTKCYR